MPYTVQFVGVVCFFRQNGSRVALMPDGRDFDPQHEVRIVVNPRRIIPGGTSGWNRNRADELRGIFRLPRCTVRMSGIDQAGPLNSSAQDPFLPRLQVLNPAFQIDPASPGIAATMNIRQGTLGAFLYPGADPTPTTSVISQLDVNHDGPITITVTPETAGGVRTIQLRPGTEIVIANESIEDGPPRDHFNLYDRLGRVAGPSVGMTPPTTDPTVPRSTSNHHYFASLQNGDDSCPNTGCCP